MDFRLFLPEEWVEDEARCKKAKVPEAERKNRTKMQLALEMVRVARERGLGHQWVGADALYGNSCQMTDALDEMGETFLMDVSRRLLVWNEDPEPQPPQQQQGGKGRPSKRHKCQSETARNQPIAKLVKERFEKESREVVVRETTKGSLCIRLWVCPVWVWNERRNEKPRRRLLVVRKESDGTFKYSLSNARGDTSWERLGYMQAQRYFIERTFEDAKSELGMAQYEVRGWRGWHHHMTLCCMGLLFALKERLASVEHTPLLSVRDIVELLASYLPRKSRDPDEVLAALNARHAARQAAIESALRKKRL